MENAYPHQGQMGDAKADLALGERRRNGDVEVLVWRLRGVRVVVLRVEGAAVHEVAQDLRHVDLRARRGATREKSKGEPDLRGSCQRVLGIDSQRGSVMSNTGVAHEGQRGRTGLSTSTVMLLPGVMVDMSAGAPMAMRCANAEEARQARAKMVFIADVAVTVEVAVVKGGNEAVMRREGGMKGSGASAKVAGRYIRARAQCARSV